MQFFVRGIHPVIQVGNKVLPFLITIVDLLGDVKISSLLLPKGRQCAVAINESGDRLRNILPESVTMIGPEEAMVK